MKDRIVFIIICFASIAMVELCGFSRDAGLFGLIVSSGLFLIGLIEEQL